MKSSKKLRTKLVNRRLKLKKTHQQVADEVGITRSYYTNIERGIKDPSLEVAYKIAKALQSNVDALFFEPSNFSNNTIGSGCVCVPHA